MPAALAAAAPPLRDVLERQFELLAPVLEHLRQAAAAPNPLHDIEWRGISAEAASEFLGELRGRLGVAEVAVEHLVRAIRLQLAHLP